MKMTYFRIAVLMFSSLSSYAQTKDNAELAEMYHKDQSSRMVAEIDWKVLSKQDSMREVRVYELIKEGKVVTGKDYYHSAMIFQHGIDTIASGMAVKQMRKAIELDSTVNKWLLAAAIDRDLMSRELPQVYGTQFVKIGEHGKWERYKIDTTKVTDEERKYYNVETLAEQKAKEHDMNLLVLSTYYSKTNSIDKTIALIKAEKKKGDQSEYNVSESGLKSFGYELMTAGKDADALKIFKLNTSLYPKGFKAFDSYGECLMKLHRKEEALKAYKQSLELNPRNDNARRVLEENR